MQRLTAKELQRRYRAGERNFAEVDLSGESLRGMNLKGIDLSGADLSRTDIRGTQFVNASLQSTQFGQARAGLQGRWLIGKLAFSLSLAILFSYATSSTISQFVVFQLFQPVIFEYISDLHFIFLISPSFLTLFILLGMFASIVRQGLTFKTLTTVLLLSFIASLTTVFTSGGLLTGASIVALIAATAGLVAVILAVVDTGPVSGTIAVIFTVANVNIVQRSVGLSAIGAGAVAGTVAGAVTFAVIVLNIYVAWRSLKGDKDFAVIRVFALAIGAVGGTSFAGADLTRACFAQAILKNTNFAASRQHSTVLTNVRWEKTKKLDRARVGNSILQNPQVLKLVVTLNGANQNYFNTNLRGANLVGVNLTNANLNGAILSEAVLSGANLQHANLTEASCISTDFSSSSLTGATLEAWNIESSTCLDNVHCDYVYLLHNQRERRPSSGSFAPSEFSKLFQEVLDTIDLIFQNGVDWKAFVQTFKDVKVEHEGANLDVLGFENKGDGVVVVKLQASLGADKSAIH
ncbi:pentapeptide repeat-containing protein [Nodosilinea sp. LEGE 06152]|uniref:pentapeptide repeat-containing protein n=1 Tax=Nodosilinea sp. LEGE 06152 TaxID=2777966 RepID=UPI0018804626|nr:pentapeptide repeat-containing protein [Nodosilinea sp. LEGE 06152]MBE9157186.1 pentapeptide repeat-containing protein [Nodosilinea sp. LEGE 06152]